MLLKEYIVSVLSEAFSFGRVKEIVDELNRVTEEYYRDDKNYDLCYDIISVAERFGLTKIGAGAYRKVYSLEGEDWVLKVAYGFSSDEFAGAKIDNAGEVDISQGRHGIGPRDLFVQVYDWDKISDKPVWLFAQKVVPLEDTDEHFSVSDMENIFPTLWSSLVKGAQQKQNVDSFCGFVADTYYELNSSRVSKASIKSGLSREGFYQAMKEAVLNENDLVSFDEVKFEEDYSRIARACAFSRPDDMHTGNIGVVPSNPELGPNSIVILDYMLSRPAIT